MTSTEETLSEADLHYLGGVIDSDGSVYISVNKKNCGIGYRVRPKFSIEMTYQHGNKRIRDLFKSLGEELDVSFSLRDKSSNSNDNRDDRWKFEISSNSSFLEFINFMKPYVRSKNDDIELVLSGDWNTEMRGRHISKEDRVERLFELIEIREELRESSSNRETKYTKDYFMEEFNHDFN